MRKLVVLLLFLFCAAGALLVTPVRAAAEPIYGIWFYQQQDDITIVSYNHVHTDVTDEYFGTQYTDAATSRCATLLGSLGMQLQYLVRYRQDPTLGWVVYCYTDSSTYVTFSGADFGQMTIDEAVCRARQIVYNTCTGETREP